MPSSREPLAATVLPDPPPRPRSAAGGWLVAGGAFLLFVACFAALLWGLGKLLATAGSVRPSQSGALLDRWETSGQRLAAVKSALESDETGLTAADLRELRRFFERVRDGLRPQNGAEFVALVDLETAADRVLRHPASSHRARSERRLIEQQLEHRVHPPAGVMDLTITHGERSAEGEALIYTIATGQDIPPAPMRWWLRREGRSWRICDWERIDRGFSETARWALEGSLSPAEAAIYRQALEGIARAQVNIDGSLVALAARDLLDVQSLSLPAAVHDLVQLDMAWVWEQCARSDQVLAACNRVRDPAASPGVHYLRALAYARREDFPAILTAAAAYRAAAGRHPHLLEVEAGALEAVGRRADAAECWWQRLLLLPEDTEALAEFCRLSDEALAARAGAALRRTRHPSEFALQAGRAAVYRDDDATARAIERYFREANPNAAELELLAGWRHSRRQEHALAAAHYRAAAQQASDPDDRQAYFDQFLDALAFAGRAAQGYLAAEDPAAALAHLTAGLDDGEAPLQPEDLPRLVALHRRRAPMDPRLPYLEGVVALNAGRYAEAESRLQAALAKAAGPAADGVEDLAALARPKLVEARYRQKRLAAAYGSAPSRQDEVFRELAHLCQQDHNWAALDELIALHRRQAKADPWIDYFLALRAQAEGNAQAALAAVQRAEAGGDESLKQTVGWLKNRLLIDSGSAAEAYQGSSDQREAFRRLVTHLASEQDWDGVLELTTLHAAAAPRRSATLYWRAIAHWHRGDYQELVDSLSPWPEDRVGRLEPGQLTELCDKLVRSLVRLGKLPEAQVAADRARDEYGVEPPMVPLKLAQGDRAGALQLIEHPRIARELFGRQLHRDRDLAALLTAPELAPLRRQHALALPDSRGPRDIALVLLLGEPPAAGQLERIASAVGGDAVHLPPRRNRESLLWERGPEAVVLTAGSGAYCDCDALLPDPGDPRRDVLELHAGWMALDLLVADELPADSDALRVASRLSAELAELAPQALYYSGPRARHLELFDGAVQERLRGGAYLAAKPAVKSGRSVALFAGGEFTNWDGEPEHSRAVWKLADAARVANPAGHALIRVDLQRGHAIEEQWLKVIRSRPQKFGRGEFIAELAADSRLWPFLRAGERLRVESYEVLAVAPLPAAGPSK